MFVDSLKSKNFYSLDFLIVNFVTFSFLSLNLSPENTVNDRKKNEAPKMILKLTPPQQPVNVLL